MANDDEDTKQVIEDPLTRFAVAQFVENFVKDIDHLYSREPTDIEIENFREYFKRKRIAFPKIPEDSRKKDVQRMMYRAWASIECLNLMCGLLGTDESSGATPNLKPSILNRDRFADLDM